MKIFYSLAKPGRKWKNLWWGGVNDLDLLWPTRK